MAAKIGGFEVMVATQADATRYAADSSCGKHNPHGCGCFGVYQYQLLVNVLVQGQHANAPEPSAAAEGVAGTTRLARPTSPSGFEATRKQLTELSREIDLPAENFPGAPAEDSDRSERS